MDWGEPNCESSLVIRCHHLRRMPLRDFTVEDLRLMIGQHIGLDYLLPLALAHLEHDPWVSGDYYEGDLMESVRRLPSGFWEKHPEWLQRWQGLVSRVLVDGP